VTTLNRSFSDYIPRDNDEFAVPVQQGNVWNLSAAITPTGQAILGWYDPTANEMRCAVVPIFDDIFQDDIVPAGDVRTIFTSAVDRLIYTGVVWIWEGTLYAFLSDHLPGTGPTTGASNGKVYCYVADDVEDPTSWTLMTTLRDIDHTGEAALSVRQGGIPTVMDSGRWVLPFHMWDNYATGSLIDRIGLYTSDDDGDSFPIRLTERHTPLQGGTAGPESTTVAYQPSTDKIWLGSHMGPTTQWRPYSSTDEGTTWATNQQATNPDGSNRYVPHYFIDDGTTMYAGVIDDDLSDGALWLYAVDDATDPSTWTDLNMRGIISEGFIESDGFQIIPIAYPTASSLYGVVFTARNRIAFTRTCEPIHPQPLHIPYKERLNNLAVDLTDEGITRAADQQYQNLKVVEWWAREWMSLAESPSRCILHIPFKDHSNHPQERSARESFENWKAIERWADKIADGSCGCNCSGATDPPDRCRLRVPFKDCLTGADLLDPDILRLVAEAEFQNHKALELWANRYARAECGCTT
jgi:hypothetical protein